jgi:hypothetical protein
MSTVPASKMRRIFMVEVCWPMMRPKRRASASVATGSERQICVSNRGRTYGRKLQSSLDVSGSNCTTGD